MLSLKNDSEILNLRHKTKTASEISLSSCLLISATKKITVLKGNKVVTTGAALNLKNSHIALIVLIT